MNKNKIQLAATLVGASTLSDGGMSIRFHTQELSDESAVEVMKHRNGFGYVLFSPNKFQDGDIPEGEAEYEGKSPSKRFRDRLFVYYTEHLGKDKQHFNGWYKKEMDRVGQVYLNKMDKV